MNNPPNRIFGLRHSTALACLALYIVLSCAPSSKTPDPANGAELSVQSIQDEFDKAISVPDFEATFGLIDTALIVSNTKYFQQTYARAHYKRELIYKDSCIAVKRDTVQETNEVVLPMTGYGFDNPGCKNSQSLELPMTNVSAKQFAWQQDSWAMIQKLILTSPKTVQERELATSEQTNINTADAAPSASPEPEPHFYGLSVVKFIKHTANCTQYENCDIPMTRIEFDRIIYPHDEVKRQRFHIFYEVSAKIPFIFNPFTSCVSTLALQEDGNKLPITNCLEVQDFMAGSGKYSPSPTPGASPVASPAP